ncbi:hypothetical protein DV702_04385 [Sporosarcina sp. PTS2304]|uniref:polysaccharide deacetylase family protein n=1 Tax=Sporosarcina sp. PTS2304 TaxID=2283194 RepID=UPI000E0DC75B|nr:polysaccharide deacetylase family protein [Sporosarcina sp. PTS2304]AXH99037.1 hypothetical protein DV702_04385 [Sporosarcina sp. PTS2304]
MKQMILTSFALLVCATLLVLDNGKESSQQMITTGASLTKSEADHYIEKFQSYAKEHDVEPINATIDRVWKAIPGYNGLTVDIVKTYQMMLDGNNFDTDHVVFKEVSPDVHLDDLPPTPIYKGNPEKPMVALLINVAWGEEHLPNMLETLRKFEVKATFFFDGSWGKKHPEMVKTIYAEGHEIGNHAYSHPDLNKSSIEETRNELTKTNDVIKEAIDIKPKWFAPPSGSFNQQTIDVAHELGMKTILWTVDTVDWKKPDPTQMVHRVLSEIDKGSMVLMHPTPAAEEGLPAIIQGIQKKKLRLGTVSDLMSEKRADPYE